METVEQSLRAMLATGARDGSLRPGCKLPTERALVEQLSAPRSAVRRALDALENDGVVIRHVGRGTFLTETAIRRAADVPPDTSPAEIMQVRMLIEPQVAALAASEATSVDIERIGEYLDAGGNSEEFEAFESWDGKLHRAIAEAAHNGLLMDVFDVLNAGRALPIWGTRKRRAFTPERRARYHEEHAAIVAALRDRDSDAAETAMRRHLTHVTDNLLGRT